MSGKYKIQIVLYGAYLLYKVYIQLPLWWKGSANICYQLYYKYIDLNELDSVPSSHCLTADIFGPVFVVCYWVWVSMDISYWTVSFIFLLTCSREYLNMNIYWRPLFGKACIIKQFDGVLFLYCFIEVTCLHPGWKMWVGQRNFLFWSVFRLWPVLMG